jgi:hypothetical protein
MSYGYDIIDGIEVPQMVVTKDTIINGTHNGTVHVEQGTLTIIGELDGTLDVQNSAKVVIKGKQNGTVSVNDASTVIVIGELNGTTTVSSGGSVCVEESGKMAGTLTNYGAVIVRGVFGGAQSGHDVILEGNGYIKQPIIEDGISYYNW